MEEKRTKKGTQENMQICIRPKRAKDMQTGLGIFYA